MKVILIADNWILEHCRLRRQNVKEWILNCLGTITVFSDCKEMADNFKCILFLQARYISEPGLYTTVVVAGVFSFKKPHRPQKCW